MSIGYACLTVGVPDTDMRNCVIRNADEKNLTGLIRHNLDALEKIIDYNNENGIRLFRISSDLVPFASNPVNTLAWEQIFSARLARIGQKIRDNNSRVSMHPGQYTVLNSPNRTVVENAVRDLHYHTEVLDRLGMDSSNKIVLHIGGVYHNKQEASERFLTNYMELDESIRKRIVLENDDKSYTIAEVLDIGRKADAPVVFDNLHHEINPCEEQHAVSYWIGECGKTWKVQDGKQKIHYSQQAAAKNRGSHSETIRIREFLEFYHAIGRDDIDIMLEVKDKNRSAVKCINCSEYRGIKALETEWGRYKYSVLEKSPEIYLQIRSLLKEKKEYPAVPFYELVEASLAKEYDRGKTVNALLHVWGYFKNNANEKEKTDFLRLLENFKKETGSIDAVKNLLHKLSKKYNQEYLLQSYYFMP